MHGPGSATGPAAPPCQASNTLLAPPSPSPHRAQNSVNLLVARFHPSYLSPDCVAAADEGQTHMHVYKFTYMPSPCASA